MATHGNATIHEDVKACKMCGKLLTAYQKQFCGAACGNRSRIDHSEETLWRRFWAKVNKMPGLGPNGECWEWNGRVDGHGYGEIKVAGRYKKAHRIALFGPTGLSDEKFACHHCDNPRCVRKEHLFPGDAVDNVRDMHRKGRARKRKRDA